MENKNLIYLSVDKLHPHQDNPRKDLGDISELAESIKAKGIMQNLTVVPFVSKTNSKFNGEGMYTVIIGHRRLAAAKMAGLETVPCVIVEMSEAEQVSTMLLENMQRSDLTIYEQAKGFQMMLDLGDTIAGIQEKTGFSESTIRRRVKLAELDEKKLKAAAGRQITMTELDELNSVESVAARNELLSEIGTSNFKWKLQSIKAAERRREEQQKARMALLAAGLTEISYKDCRSDKYAMSQRYWVMCSEAINGYKRKNDEDFFAFNGDTAYLCYALTEEMIADKAVFFKEEEKRKLEKKERMDKLRELFANAYDIREEFIDNLPQSIIMKKFDVIVTFLFYAEAEDIGAYIGYEEMYEFFGVNSDGEDQISYEDVHTVMSRNSQEENIFKYLIMKFGDNAGRNCINWDGRYRTDKNLAEWYGLLVRLGYEMSDEEKALLDGTHELYEKD